MRGLASGELVKARTGCDPSSRKRGASGDGVSKRSRRLGLGPGIHGTIGTEPRTCSDAPPLSLTWEPVVESCSPICVGDEGVAHSPPKRDTCTTTSNTHASLPFSTWLHL